jgi:hypothetical protein
MTCPHGNWYRYYVRIRGKRSGTNTGGGASSMRTFY